MRHAHAARDETGAREERQREIETFFLRNGLPHLTAGYDPREDTLTRLRPALVVLFVAGLVFVLRPDWPFKRQDSCRGAYFNHLGPLLDLIAHRPQERFFPIRHSPFRSQLTNARRKPRHITMAARNGKGMPRRHDPRTFN